LVPVAVVSLICSKPDNSTAESGLRHARADRLAAGVQAVDENRFGVQMPDGWFLDAAGPRGGYEFGRYQGVND
jgi:hypothetical protein